MFALVPCVLFFDALGHEIVPLFTVASPEPQVHWPSTVGRVGLFCMCVPARRAGFDSCVRVLVRVCVSAFVELRTARVSTDPVFSD